ncbi:hypothetical protein D3C87_1803470 [compost metagenome]
MALAAKLVVWPAGATAKLPEPFREKDISKSKPFSTRPLSIDLCTPASDLMDMSCAPVRGAMTEISRMPGSNGNTEPPSILTPALERMPVISCMLRTRMALSRRGVPEKRARS